MIRFLLRFVIILAVFASVAVVALYFLSRGPWDQRISEHDRAWGVTFSTIYAKQLELDPMQAYLAMLEDLRVTRIRIPVYWQEVEPTEEELGYNFDFYDALLLEAERRNVKVMLTIGRRVPRWPECHVPEWARAVSESEQRELVLRLLRAEVEHFKNSKAVVAWQVENEPFVFFFGECPKISESFFASEVSLVRELDPSREIVVSDSGELSLWLKAAQYADVFGTTMYRVVPSIDRKHFTKWIYPAWLYNKKANFMYRFRRHLKDAIVVELQAEPWAQNSDIKNLSFEEQSRSFNQEQFRDNIRFVRDTNFKEVYFWGAEWWYWAKLHGHPEFWDIAKDLFPGKL